MSEDRQDARRHPAMRPLTRRAFLAAVAGMAAAAAVPSRARAVSWEDYFHHHYLDMTPDERRAFIRRTEERCLKEYRCTIKVHDEPALPGVRFGYGLDLSRCIGCRRCEWACLKENNISRINGQGHWIRVLKLKEGNLVKLEEAEHHYNPPLVPEKGYFYMPVQCQHCENPPCVKVCPVKATWKEPDGIVVVDYDWCIGCRYCITACPYRGRTFNWSMPVIPGVEVNPDTHLLGNRPRPRNVADKCTFCIQRTRHPDGKGRYPACVEACPVGARKFGNLLDPGSEIRRIIDNPRLRVYRLKEELNTEPKFFYYFS